MKTEDHWTHPSEWQRNPHYWHAPDPYTTEHEVTLLVAAFIRAIQPEFVVETGTFVGHTTRAIAEALKANGHGRVAAIEIDPNRLADARETCAGLDDYIEFVGGSSLAYDPPEPIGFAWLDSATDLRHLELDRFRPHLAPGAVVGVHDTGPQHQTASYLAGYMDRAITLRCPRGVTFLSFD